MKRASKFLAIMILVFCIGGNVAIAAGADAHDCGNIGPIYERTKQYWENYTHNHNGNPCTVTVTHYTVRRYCGVCKEAYVGRNEVSMKHKLNK
ncbi:MAG: hypothetical protein E7287_06985 [Lachnospiraceae bacterium]|nr:hypothetical protein [Lachnospiraceae bacterium]